MRVLVACEESQRVCIAFRNKGHEAYSCDIQDCSGGHPEWHIKGDVLQIIKDGWDLMIAHPPCTYLTNAGAVHYFGKKAKNIEERKIKGFQAKVFFIQLLEAPINRICIENPYPLKMFALPPYTQIIQPFEHGHPFKKKTCLWLKNLDPIIPTHIVENPQSTKIAGNWFNKGGGKDRQKERSKTFPGIANAMAEQWGNLIEVCNV